VVLLCHLTMRIGIAPPRDDRSDYLIAREFASTRGRP